jgi:hypothetical protein
MKISEKTYSKKEVNNIAGVDLLHSDDFNSIFDNYSEMNSDVSPERKRLNSYVSAFFGRISLSNHVSALYGFLDFSNN